MREWIGGGPMVVLIALLMAIPAAAQWGNRGGDRQTPSAEQRERMRQQARQQLFESIQADSLQRVVIDSLLHVQDSTSAAMMAEMRQGGMGDRAMMREMMGQLRQEMEALRDSTEAGIVAVLSDEQKERYATYRAEQEVRRGEWGRRPGGGFRGGGGDGPESTAAGDGGQNHDDEDHGDTKARDESP